jgi:hypothetical protein
VNDAAPTVFDPVNYSGFPMGGSYTQLKMGKSADRSIGKFAEPMTFQQIYWWCSDALKTVTPLLIGVAVAYIAYRQWWTNRHKLKLDLFDKRIAIFRASSDLLGRAIVSQSPEESQIATFMQQTREAEFLLSPDL